MKHENGSTNLWQIFLKTFFIPQRRLLSVPSTSSNFSPNPWTLPNINMVEVLKLRVSLSNDSNFGAKSLSAESQTENNPWWLNPQNMADGGAILSPIHIKFRHIDYGHMHFLHCLWGHSCCQSAVVLYSDLRRTGPKDWHNIPHWLFLFLERNRCGLYHEHALKWC